MGMIWAFLYLCPEPASAKDICSALGISPALASITLQDLQRWQVVKKITPIGKRRDYYVAEHDVWKMIRKVLREREKAGMEMVKSRLQEALEALHHEESRTLDLRSRRTSQFQKVRLEDLLSTTQTAMRLVDTLIDAGQLNVAPIFALLKPYQQLAKSVKSS
jgi:DNA-binding transcriptional regulator GbsR (MarR family)